MRLAILASGRGSNAQALLDAARAGTLGGAAICLVATNVPGAPVLDRARAAGVPTAIIPHKEYPNRDTFESALVDTLNEYGADHVALAGFMRVLGARFLGAFAGRVINIHPSLLPAFPGTHAHRQALAYGVKVSGCTVHFVDEGVDTGPVIAQAAVPVLDGDDEDALAARVLVEEHRLFPEVVRALAEGRVQRDGRRVRVAAPTQGSAQAPAQGKT